MSRKSKRILLTLASAAVGAACGAAVYFIRKGKADLETDFDDFKDEFEEEESAPAERTYTTLPKTKGAEDAAPDPESAAGMSLQRRSWNWRIFRLLYHPAVQRSIRHRQNGRRIQLCLTIILNRRWDMSSDHGKKHYNILWSI